MTRTKVRHPSQVRGDLGEDLVRRLLPDAWVVRQVRPDFGLDLHVEVFESDPLGEPGWVQTAGEHLYVQVKTDASVSRFDAAVQPRRNVAKFRDRQHSTEDAMVVPVISIRIEVGEVAMVEAMGSAVPVVLFWADLDDDAAYFVCLNDYVSKVLLPENPDYREQKTVSVRIPVANRVDRTTSDFTPFWLLARRAKLYAAFNLFGYQFHELDLVANGEQGREQLPFADVMEMIEVFVDGDLGLDVWSRRSDGWWAPIEDVHDALRGVRESVDALRRAAVADWNEEAEIAFHGAWDALRRAANLGRMYEELVREWSLPTYLSEVLRFPRSVPEV